MKKNLIIFVFSMLSLATFNCGGSGGKEKTESSEQAEKVQYTCPMHAEVVSNEAGDCPKCGMKLVEKN